MVLRKLSQSFKISLALMISVFSTGLLPSATAYAADDDKCMAMDSGKIDTPENPTTVTATAPAKQLIDGYCVKAGSDKQGDGPKYFTISPVSEITFSYPGNKEISHYSLSYTDYDECENISGNQPVGTSCTAPEGNRETQDLPGVINCELDTYTIEHQERTQSYTWDGDSWVLGAWSSWSTYDETVTPATDVQCPPAPYDECENLQGNQPQGTLCTHDDEIQYRNLPAVVDCEEGTSVIEHQQRTRSFSWNGDSWVAGDWSDWMTVDTSETATTDKECPSDEAKKVFVCKYVGTPGIDERLKEGKNPISVSVNAIPDPENDGVHIGDEFADAQERSIVIAFDEGQPAPDVSECPAPETPEPQADIDAVAVCTSTGVKVTLTNSGDADGTAKVNDIDYEVDANDTREVMVPFALGTPFAVNVEVTIGNTTVLAQNFSCAPGQGGGQTLGSSTTKTPTAPQVLAATTELPAALPSTGGEQNPMLILLASLMAYGIAYLFQGRRQLNQTRA